MKPSARVALIVALAATTAPTWASLPFYSPDYTFDSTTGTGFKYGVPGFVASGGITPDGKAANTVRYYQSNVASNFVIAAWRGQTPLPTPQVDHDHINPIPGDINRYGWVCGSTDESDGTGNQPAIWRPDGTRIDLPSQFPDEVFGYTFDMNDTGIVVGVSFERPVYWTTSHEIVELANPHTSDGFWVGEAKSISSNGIITGHVWDGAITWHAMRWDINGNAPILSQTTNTGITFTHTEGWRSLDDGTILGRGYIVNTLFPILWTPDGEAIELRKLPNSTSQVVGASEINNYHYSIGGGFDSQAQQVGVRWSPTGEPFALDRLVDAPSNESYAAYDINDFNFAVGISYAGTAYGHAVLWTPAGDAFDLNSLVEANGEWNFIGAGEITNTGWISGVGSFDPEGPAEAYRRPFSILVPFAGTYGMGDANFDESIDFADLLIVAQNYGTSTNGSFDVGDFNLDGSVNFTDLLAIAQNYGDVFAFESDWEAARGMVPEPNLVGGLIGALVMLRRRSRPAGNERRTFNVEL